MTPRPARRAPADTRHVQPSRRVAFEVLRAIDENDAYANLLLPARIGEARLTSPDAAFATELCYGTLRWRGLYDRIIELAAGRPTDRIDPPVLDLLRLGVHQLVGMRVAAHAAVDETVSLGRRSGAAAASGFVNGVLRTIARTPADDWRAHAVTGLQGDARLAVATSHPEWIVAAFRDALAAEGREDELADLLAADNAPPRVSLVALPGLAEPDELGSPGAVSPVGATLSGGDPGAVPAVAAGRARVQDEGSQLATLALSRARPVQEGERWLDLCAGPGGKAALLAAEARRAGASLLANELAPARAGLVRRALAVFGEEAPRVVAGDGRRIGRDQPSAFHRILLDAPCTGLGALRRRPEARWRKTATDLEALTLLQAELLDSAAAALRPGGLLAYVTCSPHLDETRAQVAGALQRHPGLKTVETSAVLAGIAVRDLGLLSAPAAQSWPHRTGTDAMFVQLLTKAT
ncbi:MAG: rRNA small subunit methyltransferase B [Micrococcales bacterium]|nr:rRNA small subunit methyltransferase B [Micrococcales bacterium]